MCFHARAARSVKCWLSLAVLLTAPIVARGQVVYNGTSANSVISFGVTNYGGGPNNGVPTYIANNVSGRQDILSSPAGGFQTANPVVANNIASYLFPAFAPGQYVGAFQVGGGNANGGFGQGAVNNYGTAVAFSLGDAAPGGGSASYSITSWTSNFTANALVPAGTRYGNALGIKGTLQAAGSAIAVAIRTFVSSANAASPFFGGVDLPQLVLAFSGAGTGKALGGPAGNTAAVLFNGLSFRGLAINSIPLPAAIPLGDALSVVTTVTAIADPADFSSFDFSTVAQSDPALYNAAGAPPLPAIDFVGTSVPEPGSLVLLGAAGIVAAWRRRQRR